MEPRPPILQWKVALALLAVVGIGVTLGSVLGPTHTSSHATNRLFAVSRIATAIPATTVSPTPVNPCKALPKLPGTASKAERQSLRLFRRQFCHKHR